MDSDREDRTGQVPLPGFGEPEAGDQPAPPRRGGVRHARRMSNWTLAALIAGTGAASPRPVSQRQCRMPSFFPCRRGQSK